MPVLGPSTATSDFGQNGVLASLLHEEAFRPSAPRTMAETGLSQVFIEGLICKYLLSKGSDTGRGLATNLTLPFGMIEPVFTSMRQRQLVVHAGSAPLSDYRYTLTDEGRARARDESKACAYTGPAPVPVNEYILSVEAQAISTESPRREDLERACKDISVEPEMLEQLGPAINSAKGLFLYGAPGNGKTTLAKRITACFGQSIWIPQTIEVDGLHIKLFDPTYHELEEVAASGIMKNDDVDRRWVRIRRPTVVVGGELTLDSLEVRHDPISNVSEAPLQMKSNCGCLLIDDFGRQRVSPLDLLNRWIVPLESQVDYLALANGKKIQLPFEQLLILSTNLEPKALVDEAFLRRIPYKIEVGDPNPQEFHKMFQVAARAMGCHYDKDVVDYLIDKHYKLKKRPLRRCHPRDLMLQIRNFCKYRGQPLEMRQEFFDRAVQTYFTVTGE